MPLIGSYIWIFVSQLLDCLGGIRGCGPVGGDVALLEKVWAVWHGCWHPSSGPLYVVCALNHTVISPAPICCLSNTLQNEKQNKTSKLLKLKVSIQHLKYFQVLPEVWMPWAGEPRNKPSLHAVSQWGCTVSRYALGSKMDSEPWATYLYFMSFCSLAYDTKENTSVFQQDLEKCKAKTNKELHHHQLLSILSLSPATVQHQDHLRQEVSTKSDQQILSSQPDSGWFC